MSQETIPRQAVMIACDASGNLAALASDGTMWHLNAGTREWKPLPNLPPEIVDDTST